MSPALEKDLFRRFTLLETWLPPDGLVELLLICFQRTGFLNMNHEHIIHRTDPTEAT